MDGGLPGKSFVLMSYKGSAAFLGNLSGEGRAVKAKRGQLLALGLLLPFVHLGHRDSTGADGSERWAEIVC